MKYDALVKLFEEANENFINTDGHLFREDLSERTLCGALMLHIRDLMKKDMAFDGYHVDVEYNRNEGDIKTLSNSNIFCDLIVHRCGEQDNLIALEMKKATNSSKSKGSDLKRLEELTSEQNGYKYVLGIYYKINHEKQCIMIKYYTSGAEKSEYSRLLKSSKEI